MKNILIGTFSVMVLFGCHSTNQNDRAMDTHAGVTAASKALGAHNPRAAKLNLRLGLSYLQRGNLKRAHQKLLLAMQQNDKDPQVIDGMAYYLQRTEQLVEAEQLYNRAIRLAPKVGASHNNYGVFLCTQGHYQQSIKEFRLAVLDKKNLKAAEAYENAGLCALKIPDTTQAKKYLASAIAQDPERPNSVLGLAKINLDEKHYQRAERYMKIYRQIAKPTPQSLLMTVKLAKALGHEDEAASAALLLNGKYPDSDEAKALSKYQATGSVS